MMTNTRKKECNRLAYLFAVTYMISYMTRINFGAIVSEMETATGISRSLLSMSLTGSFITYGAGQIISGIAGDRISPKKLVSIGLMVTILMNLILPLCQTPYQMLAVWCMNGFAQAFMWPPIVKLMVAMLNTDEYNYASVRVQWGSSLGTMIMYLCAPLLIALFSWRAVFWFSALSGLIGLFIWNRFIQEPANMQAKKASAGSSATGYLFTPMMFGIMVAIIMTGALRDGITTWMPSYIAETYKLSNVISILTGVVLPIFSILCCRITAGLYRQKLRNPLLCAGAIFGVGACTALLLFFLFNQGAAMSVFLAALLTGCIHGVNFVLIGLLPPFFQKYGSTSTVSGILNTCTYIGSALSTYGIALLSKGIGWGWTILIWFLIALTGSILCLVCVKPWAKEHPVS